MDQSSRVKLARLQKKFARFCRKLCPIDTKTLNMRESRSANTVEGVEVISASYTTFLLMAITVSHTGKSRDSMKALLCSDDFTADLAIRIKLGVN